MILFYLVTLDFKGTLKYSSSTGGDGLRTCTLNLSVQSVFKTVPARLSGQPAIGGKFVIIKIGFP
nr:MAG TPA: hypothetical protein [Caudoviricetes sp.]